MTVDHSHEEILYLLRRCGVGMASVETERGSVNANAIEEGDRISISVYTLEDPTVSPGKRYRKVLDEWADTPEEAARILRQGVLRHARIREVLHEAQRRIYTDQSISN
jgi:hypothetical protein